MLAGFDRYFQMHRWCRAEGLRADRLSALQQWDLSEEEAIVNEMRGGLEVIASGETLSGATRFASGIGRHGAFASD